MRVIAGSARSLKLKTLEGLDTRPTTDRIKETLFNIIGPTIYDSIFLDLEIILKTVQVMFTKESTEGFDKQRSEEMTKLSREKVRDTESKDTESGTGNRAQSAGVTADEETPLITEHVSDNINTDTKEG